MSPRNIVSLEATLTTGVESIRFEEFPLTLQRDPFELEQVLGLNSQQDISEDFVPFEESSIEAQLLKFIASPELAILESLKLSIIENPGPDKISRNLTLLDRQNGHIYVLGGIGFIELNDNDELVLKNPSLEDTFKGYQKRHGRNEGGIIYFADDQIVSEENHTPLGVFPFDGASHYKLKDKITRTETLRKKGFNTPTYLAAGRIKNLGDGHWGFGLYRTPIVPDYLLNLPLYIDPKANLKPSFYAYLKDKYAMLGALHYRERKTHGQPTVTNLAGVLMPGSGDLVQASAIMCDLDTLRDLPESQAKTITEEIAPVKTGIRVKKSPQVAAMIYDLQKAITLEFNVLKPVVHQLPNDELRLKYLIPNFVRITKQASTAYGLSEALADKAIGFTHQQFMGCIARGLRLSDFAEVLGGIFAHAVFGVSPNYASQIEVIR